LETDLEESRSREQAFEEKLKKLEDISFKIKFERMHEKCEMYVKHCKELRDKCTELEKAPKLTTRSFVSQSHKSPPRPETTKQSEKILETPKS
jgi:hypothetical protein